MVLRIWFLRPCTIRTWYLGSVKNNIEVLISNCPALVVFWKSVSAGATCFTSAKRVDHISANSLAIRRTPTTPTVNVAIVSVRRFLKALVTRPPTRVCIVSTANTPTSKKCPPLNFVYRALYQHQAGGIGQPHLHSPPPPFVSIISFPSPVNLH